MKTTEKLQSAVRCITLLVLLILSVTQSIGQEKEVALALQEGRKPGLPYLLRVKTRLYLVLRNYSRIRESPIR